ncbi:hypothetical protein [uncultured Shewanella sp.]|uniref:hypothetical protein n=1 Tax=Shewanella atlantica TaxID=271099 RepID=UPI0026188A3F|nr:hypothetical protein [uncultured Shewanella sp.]
MIFSLSLFLIDGYKVLLIALLYNLQQAANDEPISSSCVMPDIFTLSPFHRELVVASSVPMAT